jgi:hypothetical protein
MGANILSANSATWTQSEWRQHIAWEEQNLNRLEKSILNKSADSSTLSTSWQRTVVSIKKLDKAIFAGDKEPEDKGKTIRILNDKALKIAFLAREVLQVNVIHARF